MRRAASRPYFSTCVLPSRYLSIQFLEFFASFSLLYFHVYGYHCSAWLMLGSSSAKSITKFTKELLHHFHARYKDKFCYTVYYQLNYNKYKVNIPTPQPNQTKLKQAHPSSTKPNIRSASHNFFYVLVSFCMSVSLCFKALVQFMFV